MTESIDAGNHNKTEGVRMRLNTKNMGFVDKMLFILGLTLSGVIAFVLVVGVIVALIKLYMDNKMHSVRIHSAPMLDDEPEAELIAASFEQRLAEAIQLHEEAVAGNADALWEANRVIERFRLDYPGHAIADAYHGSVLVLLARTMRDPMERRKWARRGRKLLHEAAASSPQDHTIRMLRDTIASR
jgi:hypothetical protein